MFATCAAGLVLNVLVPEGPVAVSMATYALGAVAIGLTATWRPLRRRARAAAVAVVYGVTAVDMVGSASAGTVPAYVSTVLVALGGVVAVGSLAVRTREVVAYVAFQLAVLVAATAGAWPPDVFAMSVVGVAAVDVLALGLTHPRIVADRGLRRALEDLQAREAELAVALERSEAASRAKGAFLGAMSHEVRTPLTAMIGYADLLADELSAAAAGGDATATALLPLAGPIRRGGRRLLRTLDSVLDLSRLEAGASALDLGPVDLAAEARDAAEAVGPAAAARGLELRLQLAPAVALGDRGAVGHVVRNLLENAVKYTEAGVVTVAVRAAGAHAEVSVGDTGPGIAPEALGRIFEPFRQASEGDGRRHEGVGLGLSIVRRLAEAMGGAVAVESAVGVGSRFTLRLAAAAPGDGAGGPAPDAPVGGAVGRGA